VMDKKNISPVYLHDIPLPEAYRVFQAALKEAGLWGALGVEEILLDLDAVGRVLAEPVWARKSSPHYHASAMDGFALRAEDTFAALPSRPVILQIPEQAVYLDTGDALPDLANAVIPIELAEPVDLKGDPAGDPRRPSAIRLRGSVTPWSHVRPLGEDIVATQLVLPSGHILRPVDLGAIAASGWDRVSVTRKPTVAVLPTGSELVSIGKDAKSGEIIEYNSLVLAAQVEQWGGTAIRYPITPDDFMAIKQNVQKAADECELVLLNAGSSAGAEDHSAQVVEALGRLLVHGVAVRPGHPVILGLVRRSPEAQKKGEWAAIIGVPGYPVSAAMTGELFVEPLIAEWVGRAQMERMEIEAHITRKLTSPAGDDDYIRVVVGRVEDRMLAAPLARGAGIITSLVRADGIVLIPRGVQGVEAGEKVKVRLYRHPAELERTIFAIGSHDMTLDLVAQFLAKRGRRLVSANVGSQGGLVALRRGEAHLAGSHLLDPESGEYNLTAIRQYLPDIPVRVVSWVGRQQGLLVARGNPRGIRDLHDLERGEITFINRQRGAGTRVLLDYHLQKMGIAPEGIRGYAHEEYTHLAVAAAVASGRVDCGLGIAAAAKALELDFIPLYVEQYELVIPSKYIEGELLKPLFELMKEPEFQHAVASLPGYTVEGMGRMREVK
jgi:putative molybdopterin biosynthesis protein